MELYSIALGIISSLVATIIWVLVIKLYDFDSRKNNDYLLEMMLKQKHPSKKRDASIIIMPIKSFRSSILP